MNALQICRDLWLLFALVWLFAAFTVKKTQQRLDVGSSLLYGVPVFASFYLLFGDTRAVPWLNTRLYPHSFEIATLGVGLTALGIALAVWARFYIGRNWSSTVTVKVDHQLVRSGPYAWVRHPIYSGILLAVIGTAIARREPRGFLGAAVLWLGFVIKSRMEERFMRTTFGSAYEDYSRSTGALVPRLHR